MNEVEILAIVEMYLQAIGWGVSFGIIMGMATKLISLVNKKE